MYRLSQNPFDRAKKYIFRYLEIINYFLDLETQTEHF